MPGQRQMRLGAFMRPVSIHAGSWRYPEALLSASALDALRDLTQASARAAQVETPGSSRRR